MMNSDPYYYRLDSSIGGIFFWEEFHMKLEPWVLVSLEQS